ncbi:MAG TPA: ATP-binding protein [Acidimicrobiia bacterium]|nr:ATP-binding protein [Acidimicrobiia bacterium]
MSKRAADTPYRTKLSTRFIVYFAATYLVLIGLLGFIIDRSIRSVLIGDVEENLVVSAHLAAQSLPDDEAEYQDWAEAAFDSSGFRTTLIDTDGVVHADSHTDPAVMENHIGRPEVQSALAGHVGEAHRVSVSTGIEQQYVALPPEDGLIVRMSVPIRVIERQLGQVRRSIVVTAAALGLLGIGLVAFVASRLARPISELTVQAQAVAEDGTDVSRRRSRVAELDQLGLAISTMAHRLGSRLSEAEEAMATLQVILGTLPQGTVLVDRGDRITYANQAAAQILGAVPESLAHLAPLQFQAAVREARDNRSVESRVLDHGSPTRRLRGTATPFDDDDRVLLLVVDITERERTDSIRRDFVANASHELKTPVSTIIASSEALQIALNRGDESASAFAGRIEASARQLDRLVVDLLDLSRLEKESPEMSPSRLDHVVRDEVERIRPQASAKGIDVAIRTDEVTATINPRDVAIAVRNILDNAVRYTPEDGSIVVDVSTEGREAVISVTDTGEGIPTRDIERVFERFYRVDSARSRATGGTGLGLSIVKHVAEGHGGSVSVESQLGAGSTFTLRLPLEDNKPERE